MSAHKEDAMPATLDRPVTGDYDLIAALLADPTLSADEAARFLGLPLPALAVDDEPGDAIPDAKSVRQS